MYYLVLIHLELNISSFASMIFKHIQSIQTKIYLYEKKYKLELIKCKDYFLTVSGEPKLQNQ